MSVKFETIEDWCEENNLDYQKWKKAFYFETREKFESNDSFKMQSGGDEERYDRLWKNYFQLMWRGFLHVRNKEYAARN